MNTESGNVENERAAGVRFVATEIGASLSVKDLAASLVWYRDVLGFAVDQRHERGGELRAVSLSAGAVRILINQDDGAKGIDRQKGDGFSLRFTTRQGIDELAAGIKARGGVLESDPTDTPWGMRAFRLQDPDGFRLVISSEQKTAAG